MFWPPYLEEPIGCFLSTKEDTSYIYYFSLFIKMQQSVSANQRARFEDNQMSSKTAFSTDFRLKIRGRWGPNRPDSFCGFLWVYSWHFGVFVGSKNINLKAPTKNICNPHKPTIFHNIIHENHKNRSYPEKNLWVPKSVKTHKKS